MKCKNLKRVILEEGIEVIEDTAFTECKELTEIRLPSSLHDVSGDAFSNCGLKAPVFSGDGKVLVWYPQVSPTKEYTVPEGVEEIGRCAFHNCDTVIENHPPSEPEENSVQRLYCLLVPQN